jgi:hypothetical protein
MVATVLVRSGRRYYKVRVNPPSDEVALHAVRQATKQLIYTSEGAAVRAGEKAVQAGALDFEIVEDMKNALARHIAHSELAHHMNNAQIERIIVLAVKKAWPKVGKVNPLIRSADRSSVEKNIAWLLKHPKELTAKTPEMKRKQAIAIALFVWRKSAGSKRKA